MVAAISDYDVRYRVGNSGGWTNHAHSGSGQSTTITGLTNGRSYQVQVLARNGVGASAWSASASATPKAAATAPSAPGSATLTSGNGLLGVAWRRPANNGAAINDYDVLYRIGNSGSWTNHPHTGTILNTTITGLVNGSSYQVQVLARNSVGASAWSAAASATPLADWIPPSIPSNLEAEPGGGEVDLSWDASTKGSGTVGYDLQYRERGTVSWTRISSGAITGTSHTVSGLTNGKGYEFQVRASNQDTTSTWHTSAWSASASATPKAAATAPSRSRVCHFDLGQWLVRCCMAPALQTTVRPSMIMMFAIE